ncbi:MAG: hypothetical protein R3C11_18220 [Planctomycetaceae bacterium]
MIRAHLCLIAILSFFCCLSGCQSSDHPVPHETATEKAPESKMAEGVLTGSRAWF